MTIYPRWRHRSTGGRTVPAMPRVPRTHALPEHGVFHVVTRGAGGIAVYRDDPDRLRFLTLLHSAANRFEWRMDAFCLMTTHCHLVSPGRAARRSPPASIASTASTRAATTAATAGGASCSATASGQRWRLDRVRPPPARRMPLRQAQPGSRRTVRRPDDWRWSGRDTASSADQRQAVSETGARSFSGSHQARFARYHSTVSRSPCSQPMSGSQPSSRRIFDESST